jgi:hypothetical protein
MLAPVYRISVAMLPTDGIKISFSSFRWDVWVHRQHLYMLTHGKSMRNCTFFRS